MKKLLTVLLLISPTLWAQEKAASIEFEDEGTQRVVTITNKDNIKVADIFKLKKMDLRNVLKAMDVDSTQREKALVIISKSGKTSDTLLVLNRNGNEINIITKDVKSITQINAPKDEIKTFDEEETNNPRIRVNRTRRNFYSKNDFDFYLGLNSYSNSPSDEADLRAWPSKYVSIGYKRNLTLGKTEALHTVLTFGPEFSWHNFMLENSNKLIYENGQSDFVKNPINTSKSKFVVPHFTLPAMVRLGFKKERFSLGLGGYVGYRTGGHSKEKATSPREKNSYKDNVKGLSDFKYGLAAELGRKNFGLFFRYDLSPLFKENQSSVSDMRPFSFGIKFF